MLKFRNVLKYCYRFLKNGLVLNILACVLISLIIGLMGIFSSVIRVDMNLVHVQSLIDNDKVNVKTIVKGIDASTIDTRVDDYYRIFKSDYGLQDMGIGYGVYENNEVVFWEFVKEERYYNYYNPVYWNVEEVNEYIVGDWFNDLIGMNAMNSDEIVISNYLADYIIKLGVVDDKGEEFFPKSYEEIINSDRRVKLGSLYLKITGIYMLDKRFDQNGVLTSEDVDYVSQNVFRVYVNEIFLDNEYDLFKKSIYVYDDDIAKLLKVLENDGERIEIETPFSDDFQKIEIIINKIDRLSNAISVLLIMILSLIVIIYEILIIRKQRKNWDILRMLGASSKDIWKISSVQNGIIGFLSVTCGVIIWVFGSFGVNFVLSKGLGFNIRLLRLSLPILSVILLGMISMVLILSIISGVVIFGNKKWRKE